MSKYRFEGQNPFYKIEIENDNKSMRILDLAKSKWVRHQLKGNIIGSQFDTI